MVAVTGAMVDTSVLADPTEALGDLPEIAVSLVTVGELHAGVLCARDDDMRERRQALLEGVLALFEPVEVDADVAIRYGEALAHARAEGRSEKATDLLIVATAAATGRTLVTRDRKQAALARSLGLEVLEPR